MALFTFNGSHDFAEHQLDLPDIDAARAVSKFVARQFAARRVEGGHLDLSERLIVLNEMGVQVHSLALAEAVDVTGE